MEENSDKDQIGEEIILTEVLQERLYEKDEQIVHLEKKLVDREELADKLIVANMEKDDIFNEYEKILQNNVFNKMDEHSEAPLLEPNGTGEIVEIGEIVERGE